MIQQANQQLCGGEPRFGAGLFRGEMNEDVVTKANMTPFRVRSCEDVGLKV
jgi:hypothetical protein